MKRVVALMLMITIMLSSTMSVFAVDESTNTKGDKIEFETIYKYVDNETGFEEEIIQINEKKLYYYYCNSGNDVISLSIKNNELQEYSTRDQKGNVYSLFGSKVKLSHLGIKQAKQLGEIDTKELLDYMHQITDGMKKNETYLEYVDTIEINTVGKNVTRASSSSVVSSINSQIRSMGYNDFSYKVVANIPYHGIPGQVFESGTLLYTIKENVYLSEINISATIVASAAALATGDVLAVGLWIYDYYGNVKTALAQEFQKWKSQWAGSKYVSFHSQGNYWQVEKAAFFISSVGEVGALVNYPSVSADPYYDNNAKLIEYGYVFNY